MKLYQRTNIQARFEVHMVRRHGIKEDGIKEDAGF